jgi:hypothetical protein
MIRECLFCKKEFKVKPYSVLNGGGKFCSRLCFYKFPKSPEHIDKMRKIMTGRKFTEQWKNRISKSLTGRKLPREQVRKSIQSRLGKYLGEKASNWKGGKIKDRIGYIYIYCPNHPFSNNKKYVREHRLVMERHIKRYLKPNEIIHHINHNPSDNRLSNLKLFISSKEHSHQHIDYPHYTKENVPVPKNLKEKIRIIINGKGYTKECSLCVSCGSLFWKQISNNLSGFCKKCSHRVQRKTTIGKTQ